MAHNQYTCRCNAYHFPHRFGGGRCNGYSLAVEHWNTYWGHDSTCRMCNSFDANEHKCQVLDGGNHITNCEVVIEFVETNGIRFKL